MASTETRILIIDDSNSARDVIRAALYQMKFKMVEEAENGRIGLDLIKMSVKDQRPYDLVFCDINMPELNGIQLLEQVRQNEATSHIPIIIVTTEGSKPLVIKAVMSGVSGYIVKPFAMADVKTKALEVLKRSQLEHKSAAR